MRLDEVDALSPESVEDPHALYDLLRDESPVHWGVPIRARIDGERSLDPTEMASILQQFMLAGNETSTAAIAATQRFLIDQPGVLEDVRRDRSLVPAVVEEVFRLESPVQNIFRLSTRSRRCWIGWATSASRRAGTTSGTTRYSSPGVCESSTSSSTSEPSLLQRATGFEVGDALMRVAQE
jgi:cytochrome P450